MCVIFCLWMLLVWTVLVGSAVLMPYSTLKATHTCDYTCIRTQTYSHTYAAHRRFMNIYVDVCIESYCMDAHSQDKHTHSKLTPLLMMFLLFAHVCYAVIVPGVSTTTISPCWRPPEPLRACRSSRKCRSLRKPSTMTNICQTIKRPPRDLIVWPLP